MQFWNNLYRDASKEDDMRLLKDFMIHNYQAQETDGPQYEEIMKII